MGHSQSLVMPRTVDSAVLAVPSLPDALDSSEDGSLPTLTSGRSDEESSKSSSVHPSDTSYGLSSLKSGLDDMDDFAQLRPVDEYYMARARQFIASQPVFKKKLKIRVTRRMQVVVRSRVGYTQLRREVVRRRPRPAFVLDVPSISRAFAKLSLRPEKSFMGQKRESTV